MIDLNRKFYIDLSYADTRGQHVTTVVINDLFKPGRNLYITIEVDANQPNPWAWHQHGFRYCVNGDFVYNMTALALSIKKYLNAGHHPNEYTFYSRQPCHPGLLAFIESFHDLIESITIKPFLVTLRHPKLQLTPTALSRV